MSQSKCRRNWEQRKFRIISGILLLLAINLFISSVRSADLDYLQSGKQRVHPTRIIAKFARDGGGASSVQFRSLKIGVSKRLKSVPGLVVFDSSPVGLASSKQKDPQSQLDQLINQIARLRETGLFEYVEPDYLQKAYLVPNDSKFADDSLWGLRNRGRDGGVETADIDAVRAWDITTGSSDVIIAVIDTGIRYTHRELRNQMWKNPGEIPGNGVDDDDNGYVDDIFGIDAVSRTGDPLDDNDHGTHVAGTMGAAANDGFMHVGVAWKVQLMACKFLSEDGLGFTSDAIECIDYAVANGAKIINASWGGGPFSSSLFDSINAARSQGVLFVAAAGNEENDNDQFASYPASFVLDNIISVAALDRRDEIADFSNYGRNLVHLGAPGVEILSTTAGSDNAYKTFAGTSMAAPHVSGVAALILSKYPNALLPEVRTRLLSTTVPVSSLRGKTQTGGCVNAYQALIAQPDGTIEFSAVPVPGSDLRVDTILPLQIILTDVSGVTNATVRGQIFETGTEIIFRNDGVQPDMASGDAIYTVDVKVPPGLTALSIQLSIEAPGKGARSEAIIYSVVTPPGNDDFANAFEIASFGGTTMATNKLATLEPAEPFHNGIPSVAGSVWWKWTPLTGGEVIVDTAGSLFDTVIAVYTNNTLARLKEVASVDDVDKRLQGYVLFQAEAGITYRIAVAGFSEADKGLVRLRVEPKGEPDRIPPAVIVTGPQSGLTITNINGNKVTVTGTALDPQPNGSGIAEVLVQLNGGFATPANGATNWLATLLLDLGLNTIKVVAVDYVGNRSPSRTINLYYRPLLSPNDLFNNAVELLGRDGTVKVENTVAGKESSEPAHAGNPGGKSVWWYYRPTSDGILALSTENSSFNTLMAVYTGNRASELTLVADNDDAVAGARYSRVQQAVKAFELYRIAVDGLSGQSGTIQLSYTFTPATVYKLVLSAGAGGTVPSASGYYPTNTSITILAAPAGNYQFDRWDGTISSRENPLTVTIRGDTELVARFRAFDYSDDFETEDFKKLAWSNPGNSPWYVQSEVVRSGKFAARSGKIDHGQSSSLILMADCQAGEGAFEFQTGSESGWDVFEFYITSAGRSKQRLGKWSGQIAWQKFQFPVPKGTNLFEWRYSKDFQNSVAPDAVFIDNLELPLFAPIVEKFPARLAVNFLSGGTLEINIQGQSNQSHVLQVSPDLFRWSSVLTNTSQDGSFQFMLPASGQLLHQFYRVMTH